MDFGLSEEQKLLQQTLRRFLEDACSPARRRTLFDAETGHDAAVWTGLAELGLTGMIVPEAYGGASLQVLDLALVCEVLGEHACPSPFLVHALASLALAESDDDALRARWLPRLADGSAIATVAFAEDGDRWEPETWRTRVGAGALSGVKRFVPHADVADLIVVGVEGGGLALVETDTDGLKIDAQAGVDRTRPVFRVDFDGVRCDLLGADPRLATRLRDVCLVLLAADAFGAAAKLVDTVVEYAQQREQFGRKLGGFQAVKHQIARLGLDVEPTRALFWHAAYAVDRLPEEGERAAALAKAHLTDRAVETGRMAVELHGGYGFTWACDVHIWLKRALFDRAFLGTPESLRERCAALAGW